MTARPFAYALIVIGIAAIIRGYAGPVQESLWVFFIGLNSFVIGLLLLVLGRGWGPDRAPTRERWGRGPAH